MVEVATRAWTGADRADQYLTPSRARRGVLSAIAFYGGSLILGPAVTAGLGGWMLHLLGVPRTPAYVASAIVMWPAWTAWLVVSVRSDRRAHREWIRRVTADRQRREVQVVDVRVARWWEVTGADDTTDAFLLDGGDGQFVYVASQDLAERSDDHTFPTSLARIECLPATRIVLAAAGRGDVLPPDGTLDVRSLDVDPWDECAVLNAGQIDFSEQRRRRHAV